jgi:hypothetical protein
MDQVMVVVARKKAAKAMQEERNLHKFLWSLIGFT